MRYCNRESVSRTRVAQQSILDFLSWHAPELEPEGTTEEILSERWATRGTGVRKGVPNGPSKVDLNNSSAMKLHRAPIKRPSRGKLYGSKDRSK